MQSDSKCAVSFYVLARGLALAVHRAQHLGAALGVILALGGGRAVHLSNECFETVDEVGD